MLNAPITSANEGETKTYTFTVTDPGTDGFSLHAITLGSGATLVAGSYTPSATGGSFQVKFLDGNASESVADS